MNFHSSISTKTSVSTRTVTTCKDNDDSEFKLTKIPSGERDIFIATMERILNSLRESSTVSVSSAGAGGNDPSRNFLESIKKCFHCIIVYVKLHPSKIRFSQDNVNNKKHVQGITKSMQDHGWKDKNGVIHDPIDVVLMPDGFLTSLDNRRLMAAQEADIPVYARVHLFFESLPENFSDKRKIPADTWGEAIRFRVSCQPSWIMRMYHPDGTYVRPLLEKIRDLREPDYDKENSLLYFVRFFFDPLFFPDKKNPSDQN